MAEQVPQGLLSSSIRPALPTSRLFVTSEKKKYTSYLVKGKVLITTFAGLGVTVFKSL